MTKQEAIDYITTKLAAPITLAQNLIDSFLKVLDFSSQSAVDDVIPDWTNAITFQTDGSDGGKYCLHPDDNGKKRIFETKIDDNLNNEPPTDPDVTENASWEEISQSAGSGISEWAAGVYGSGLVIVYHNHSVNGGGLYKLLAAARPYASTDIEAEITAGDWEKIITNELDPVVLRKRVTISSAGILNLFTTPLTLIGAPVGGNKLIRVISAAVLYKYGTTAYTIGGGTTIIEYAGLGSNLATGIETILTTAASDRLTITGGISSSGNEPSKQDVAVVLRQTVQNPADGDGTLKIDLLYTIVDFN